MIIKIWKIPFCYLQYPESIQFTIEERGYLELEEFDEGQCWHICNWSCWSNEKPNNLFSDVDVANDDIIFHNPKEDRYHLALTNGWQVEDSLESIINYCEQKKLQQ